MGSPQEESWWLDSSNDSVMWARLRVFTDGGAEVLDLDGKRHHFASKRDAVLWLQEDEYLAYRDAIAEGEIPSTVLPPEASTEAELVRKMVLRLQSDA